MLTAETKFDCFVRHEIAPSTDRLKTYNTLNLANGQFEQGCKRFEQKTKYQKLKTFLSSLQMRRFALLVNRHAGKLDHQYDHDAYGGRIDECVRASVRHLIEERVQESQHCQHVVPALEFFPAFAFE